MNIFPHKFLILSFSLLIPFLAKADVVINELMQSNVYTIFENNDFPDSWVELYNSGNEDADLSGYGISVKDKFSKAWILPQGTKIQAKGFLVIYCDKEGKGLHADFNLDSGKSNVYLFSPSGEILEDIALAKMPATDIAYGRITDGGDQWAYFVNSTPGKANGGPTASKLVPEPEFSAKGGAYSSSFSLEVAIPKGAPDDAVLCVTTDGREPVLADATASPFVCTVDTNTIVRAKIFTSQQLIAPSVSNTYIFDNNECGMDILAFSGDKEYFYNDSIGILQNFLTEWRRPVNIEYYHEGKCDVNQLGETRIHGGYSRKINPQKSLAFYANKRFGTKRFNTSNFWPDKPNVVESKSFIIRNAGNDYSGAHIRDSYIQRMIGTHTDNLDWQAHRPVKVYLNAEFIGVYNLRERSNDDYVEANYDGLEDIDMSENWVEQKAGDKKAVDDFIDFYSRPDLTLEQLEEVFDIDSFLQKLAADIYATNYDFIRNNAVIWRSTIGDDKRWRVLVKDLDTGVGLYGQNITYDMFKIIDNYIDNEEFSSESEKAFVTKLARLYQFFLDDPKASKLLIDRLLFFLGDFFSPVPAKQFFNEMLEEFGKEMPATYAIYHQGEELKTTVENWTNHVNNLIPTWLEKRHREFPKQMSERFKLGAPVGLQIIPDSTIKPIVFGKAMTQDAFNGYYFCGSTLNLDGYEGYVWRAAITDNQNNIEVIRFPIGAEVSYTIPAETSNVKFEMIRTTEAVPTVNTDNDADCKVEYYTLDGQYLGSRVPNKAGIYLQRKGNITTKFIRK